MIQKKKILNINDIAHSNNICCVLYTYLNMSNSQILNPRNLKIVVSPDCSLEMSAFNYIKHKKGSTKIF